ncbi:MAG: hypothetical protein QM535_04065 [Limnohabitans sp.]|nr:hypothetical protein [Limnohabitans sp.]
MRRKLKLLKRIGIGLIIFLSLISAISIVYAFKLYNESNEDKSVLIADKENVLKQLRIAKDSLDVAIASNTALSEELMIEREKVQNLINEIESSKANYQSVLKYKEQLFNQQASVHNLMKNVNSLKLQNEKLNSVIDSTSTELAKSKKFNDTLATQKEILVSNIRKAAEIKVIKFEVNPIREKYNGEYDVTYRANRINAMRINFILPENHLAKAGDKKYYIQIIDSHNNVLGEKSTVSFSNDEKLLYSLVAYVKYQKRTETVEKQLEVSKLVPGTYYANLYGDSNLLAKTNFILR